uniref:Uncharacterized protein n=1 Tax=Zea mays TaxID=4577 RepID=A0A804MJ58_MAIZE
MDASSSCSCSWRTPGPISHGAAPCFLLAAAALLWCSPDPKLSLSPWPPVSPCSLFASAATLPDLVPARLLQSACRQLDSSLQPWDLLLATACALFPPSNSPGSTQLRPCFRPHSLPMSWLVHLVFDKIPE